MEITDGVVTVALPPTNAHNLTAARLRRLLYPKVPEEWEIFQTLGLAIPGKTGLYIPDLAVVPVDALVAPENRVPAGEAKLAVEITSPSSANHDRVIKHRGYAHAGVDLYLLLDPWHSGTPTVTLYGEPADGVYRVLAAAQFGEVLELPAPFGLSIDTASLPW